MDTATQNGLGAYELLLILQPSISDEDVQNEVEKVKSVIGQREGEVVWTESMGKRKLAYGVRKEKRGVYIFIHFRGNRNTVSAIQRTCRLQEAIMRFMTVKIKLQDLKYKEIADSSTPLTTEKEGSEREGVAPNVIQNG